MGVSQQTQGRLQAIISFPGIFTPMYAYLFNLKEGYHWIAAVVDIEDKMLICYDSLLNEASALCFQFCKNIAVLAQTVKYPTHDNRHFVQGQQGQHDDLLRALKHWLADLAPGDKQPGFIPIIADMQFRCRRNEHMCINVATHILMPCSYGAQEMHNSCACVL